MNRYLKATLTLLLAAGLIVAFVFVFCGLINVTAHAITTKEINTLAKLTYLEARGESDQGQRAVVEVVLNRVEHNKFPDTVQEVVFARNQFTPAKYIHKTKATSREYRNVYHVLNSRSQPILPRDTVYFSTKAQNKRVVKRIGSHVFCRI